MDWHFLARVCVSLSTFLHFFVCVRETECLRSSPGGWYAAALSGDIGSGGAVLWRDDAVFIGGTVLFLALWGRTLMLASAGGDRRRRRRRVGRLTTFATTLLCAVAEFRWPWLVTLRRDRQQLRKVVAFLK